VSRARQLRLWLAIFALACATFGALLVLAIQHLPSAPRPAVCITVDANGAPAPDSCADPGSYQVTP
jgi:hypothetical protein